MQFPNQFMWGVATSAYQIEGSTKSAGRGTSIWDTFGERPYQIAQQATGDPACDHYQLWQQDIDLLAHLNVRGYRFSISWPRILPQGTGQVNTVGLDFYDRLLDQLLANGIQPNVTLFHWDYPQALQERGGWAHPDSPAWFADYAGVVFARLADRVPLWATLNEPWVFAQLGHHFGLHAPGLFNATTAYQVGHHLLLGHGQAVQAFRQSSASGQIGIVLNLPHLLPASDAPADLDALARVRWDSIDSYLAPLLHGIYPAGWLDWLGEHAPALHSTDLATIAQPFDWLGINYYFCDKVAFDQRGGILRAKLTPHSAPGWGQTDMGWGIYPAGLSAVLADVRERYGNPPVYITENGAAFTDTPDEDGFVSDAVRLQFVREHLQALYRAHSAGSDVRGYYAWSFLDNFEWERGYQPRFGLVRVDYETQRRIPKQSALWYRQVCQTGVVSL